MIRDLPDGDRPRERLRDRGASSLSNAELLAILLRTGTRAESVLDLSTRLLARFQGVDGLARATHQEISAQHGFGEAKAAQLMAAIELGKRVAAAHGPERPLIHSPQDVADLLQPEMGLLDQEHFRVVVLNTKNQVLATPDVFVGSVNSTSIRTAEVFRDAVRLNAPAIIVVHNHPSGDPEPSREDAAVTRELVAAGKALDIDVLDHVVLGRDGFVSLKERGLGFG
ncbi:MAG: DNA repair protein RadC [Dehalococcoidia bacterium]